MHIDIFTGWYFLGANNLGGWIFLLAILVNGALFIWADTRWRRIAFRKWVIWAAAPSFLFIPTLFLLLGPSELWNIRWLPLVIALAGCLGTLMTGLIVVLYALRFLVQFPGHIYYLEDHKRGERKLLGKGVTNLENALFVKVSKDGCSIAVPGSRQTVIVDGLAVRRTTIQVEKNLQVQVGDRHYRILVME